MYIIQNSTTKQYYENELYSGSALNRIKLYTNYNYFGTSGVEKTELTGFEDLLEKFEISNRSLPEDGTSRYSLDNFIAKEITMTVHDIQDSQLVEPLYIEIGTYLNATSSWLDIPIGVFYINNIETDDDGTKTITLRDGASKFDFNYNGKDTIGEEGCSRLVLLKDICSKAGLPINDTRYPSGFNNFENSLEIDGYVNNSVTGRQYISFLAEQSGAIPYIDRETGCLQFIGVDDIESFTIPNNIFYIESFKTYDSIEITDTIFEDGIIKLVSSPSGNGYKLYLNSANPYITKQEILDTVHNKVNGLSLIGFSSGKILGNPCLDGYDKLIINDNYESKTYTTLANHKLTYSGNLIQEFETKFSLEDNVSNVTMTGTESVYAYAKTNIDNVNAQITLKASKSYVDDEISSVKETITPTYSKIEIQKIISGNIKEGEDLPNVSKVVTASATFDKDGLTIEQGGDTHSTLNDKGLKVYDSSNNTLLNASVIDGEGTVIARNMNVNNYLNIVGSSRIQESTIYDELATCVYWVGSD